MTDLVLHVRLVGMLLLGVGAFHALLPTALGWRTDLAGTTLATRQVSYVHCFFIGLTCVLIGLLALAHADTLVNPAPLGSSLAAGLVLFWGARLAIQVVGFSPALWRGDAGRTAAHVGFVVLWTYVTGVWVAVLLRQAGV